jgi:hypothetical protein
MKVKLSIDEQIDDLKYKNVKFEIFNEEYAKKFLQNNNYYFKLKSYAHNYSKYSKVELNHKYINLDFAYLVELSTLDMYLRRLIVGLCLDIEHILKVRLIKDVTKNDNENGYSIVQKYVADDYTILSNLYTNIDSSATSDLIKKFHEDEENIPIWSFIETLSFGRFIELYNLYYGIYGGYSYTSYLGSIKFLRNAAAHNSCLLNSLRKPYSIKINKNKDIMDCLSKTKIFTTSYKTKMENPVIHDFVVLLFVYMDILNTASNRNMRGKGFDDIKKLFFDTMIRNKDYFIKNDALTESYNFVCQVIKYLENCRNKPILKK